VRLPWSGGGIDNTYRATLNAQNCTFSGNRAAGGGGLHNYGSTATLFQCTLSGNIASGQGAGALNVGGSLNGKPLNAALNLRACTVTLNRAPYSSGLGNLRNAARAVLSVRSSIVAGNLISDLGNNDILQNAGFNLLGGASGLAALANNGGPTLTHALLPGSRAINAGDTAPGSAFDQRGAPFARVRGGRADSGAFERQEVPSSAPTPTPAPTATPTPLPTAPATLGPGQVLNAANGHVYEVVSARLTWEQARAAAQGRLLGATRGHLASITSPGEQQFVAGLAAQAGQVEGWLGGVQPQGSAEPGGGFTWITGEPFSYAHWRQGEPNNAPNDRGSEDAILFTVDATWNDVPRLLPIEHYFVEYDFSPAQRSTPPPSLKLA